nr:hypothetical protein LTR18_011119 [Exophiala xenobiotica]
MGCTATHPLPSETAACNPYSLPQLKTHTNDFPTPVSLHASCLEELHREPLVPQFPGERELTELYNFFVENLLRCVPILLTEHIGSYEDMVRNGGWLLSCSMAYVAAGFVPGCKAVRARLAPSILAYLKQCALDNNEESRWMALQAVAVLYNWTMPKFHITFPDQRVPNPPLAHNVLRVMWNRLVPVSAAEEASQDVARCLEHRLSNSTIRKHLRGRRYLCWLWVYTITQYRTWLINPGNIVKAEPAINNSKYIFRDYITDEAIGPIIAQVELCLILERLPHVGPETCSSRSGSASADCSFKQRSAFLKDLDDDLDSWYREWLQGRTKCGFYETLEAYYRFTRFRISEQATKLYQSCSVPEMLPSTGVSPIETATERAFDLCSVLLDLKPLSRCRLCFIPEDVFALVLYGCEYILAAQSTSSNLDTRQQDFLRATAELMIDVGTYDKEWTASQGSRLLRQLST